MRVLYSALLLLHFWRVENTMPLSEVLTEMKKLDSNKNPVPFSIVFRTYNRQNKYGGKLVSEQNATLLQAPKTPGKIRLSQNTAFKNPNHFANRTRNIKTSEGIKKVNIFFIIEFNGYQVIL